MLYLSQPAGSEFYFFKFLAHWSSSTRNPSRTRKGQALAGRRTVVAGFGCAAAGPHHESCQARLRQQSRALPPLGGIVWQRGGPSHVGGSRPDVGPPNLTAPH